MHLISTITLSMMLSLSKPVMMQPATESKAPITTEATNKLIKGDVTYQQLLDLSPQNIEALTGQQLSFKEKIGLSMLKRDIKSKIKSNEISATDKVNVASAMAGETAQVNFIGFLAGLVLGLIGVLLVHIFSKDQVMRRSSWYGWGAWLIILLIALL